MTNGFTTKNESYIITRGPRGELTITYNGIIGYDSSTINELRVAALEEYFIAKRDKEFGHWRYNEIYVAFEVHSVQPYMQNKRRTIHVLNQRTGKYHERHEGSDAWHTSDEEVDLVAREWFAAHPAPKPWLDAKPGEWWTIETPHYNGPTIVKGEESASSVTRFEYPTYGGSASIPVGSSRITNAVRV